MPPMHRRSFLARLAATAAAPAAAGSATSAFAQTAAFPSKPIRMIIPFGAGSTTDLIGRIVSASLSKSLGQPIIVENKPGADGAIAGTEVKRAAPDGHTLLFATNSPLAAVPYLQKAPPYDVMADFTPVSHIGYFTFFVVTHPSIPAKTLAELIAHVQANPGKVNYASGNTTAIVSTALLATLAKMDMVHVPYKTEPQAIPDLLSGQTQVMVATYSTTAAHVKDGKLRALATTLPVRSSLMPDVPSLSEAGFKDFPVVPWAAMVGPAGMPKDVVERINKEVVALLATAEVKEQFEKQAFAPKASTPGELSVIMKDQIAAWAKTMKAAGIEPQ